MTERRSWYITYKMRKLFRFALRNLRKNLPVTVLSVVSVLLSTMMISMVIIFFSSLSVFLQRLVFEERGDWHGIVKNLDKGAATELVGRDMVEAGWICETAGYTNVHREIPVYGFSPELFSVIPFEMISGSLPQREDEIMIHSYDVNDFAPLYDQIGDKISLDLTFPDGRSVKREYTVCGIYNTSAPVGGLITIGCGQADLYNVVLRVHNPKKAEDLLAEFGYINSINNTYDTTALLNHEYLAAIGAIRDEANITELVNAVVIFIVLISILLIYNAFVIALGQRKKTFVLLTTLGAGKWQKRLVVLFEAFLISAVGIPLGIVGGICINVLVLPNMGIILPFFASKETGIQLFVTTKALLVSALVGFLAVVISAYIPARKAEKISAVKTIRSINLSYKESKIRTFLTRRFDTEGMLAGKNYETNRRKYQAVSVTLAICVVLFVTAGILCGYLIQGAVYEPRFDIGIYLDGYSYERYKKIQPQIDRIPEIDHAEIFSSSHFVMHSEISTRALSTEYRYYHQIDDDTCYLGWRVVFIDDRSFESFTGLDAEDLLADDGDIKAVFCNRTSSGNTYYDVFKPGLSEIDYYDDHNQIKSQKIAKMLSEYPYSLARDTGLIALYPISLIDELGYSIDEMDFMVVYKSGEPEAAAAEIAKILKGGNLHTSIVVPSVNMAENLQTIRGVELLIHLFVLMLTLISLLSAVSILSVNMRLRKREFAILKSVGMQDAAIKRMVGIECFYYGLYALIYGLIGTFAVNYSIYSYLLLSDLLDDLVFKIPWGHIAVAFAGVFAIVATTVIYAVSRLGKINIIDAVKREIH